ncbi:transposase family protein [Streptococcus pneumoniae]|nr:transposase family protein [Streptococcus pneumoniae]
MFIVTIYENFAIVMELLMPILEDVMNKLQDVIQGLEKEVIKSIVNRRWTRMLFENR